MPTKSNRLQRRVFCVLAFLILFSLTSGLYAKETESLQSIMITETGVGPINATTLFDKKTIQKLFPTFTVTEGTEGFEDASWPTLELSNGKSTLLTISSLSGESKPGDTVGHINILVPGIYTDQGDQVGDSYKKVYRNGKRACDAGIEQESGTANCLAPHANHIILQLTGNDASDGDVLPSDEIIQDWKIIRITWTSSSTEPWAKNFDYK